MATASPIGEQVARLRVLRAWSQEELAHRADVAVDTVRKLESGTRGMVRLHTLSMISAALDVELSARWSSRRCCHPWLPVGCWPSAKR
jgi:transcriptional regulator with XRE-family HTH domain